MSDGEKNLYVYITSLVSQRDGTPRVQIEIGNAKMQVDVAKALEIAGLITDASEAAMSDAFLVNFLKEKVEVPLELAAQILVDFREYRDKIMNPLT